MLFRSKKEHKDDMDFVFKGRLNKYRDLDYIACWFFKGSNYIRNSNIKLAFVSTNSICQGDSVGLFWPNIFSLDIDIFFTHTSFKWQNNAKSNAGVVVVIVGLKDKKNKAKKLIFTNQNQFDVDNISPYLTKGGNLVVSRRKKVISNNLPKMNFGNMPNDGGGLILSTLQKEEILDQNPECSKIIRKFVGSQEFIRGQDRWCLWINDEDLPLAMSSSLIKDRINSIQKQRESSSRIGTVKAANTPHKFSEIRHKEGNSIIIPRVSSERRDYLPIGFLDENSIISDSAQAIYEAEPWLFGLLASKMHMVWLKAVGGRLKTDIRYSAEICYNTFPFPNISEKQKQIIQKQVYNILSEREKHPEKTMAQLYDPDKMPDGLRQAHHFNDLAIESCYRQRPFTSDEERLEYLFKLYEKMTDEENLNLLNSTPLKQNSKTN